MVWAKLDDGYPDHPKIERLSDGAFRLHTSAICYCNRLLTDGEVPAARPPRLMPVFRPRYIVELVEAGVWHEEGHGCERCPQPSGGWVIHDFLAANPSRTKVLAEREAAAERQRRARESRRESRRDSRFPDPTRPDPPSGGVGSRGLPDAAEVMRDRKVEDPAPMPDELKNRRLKRGIA